MHLIRAIHPRHVIVAIILLTILDRLCKAIAFATASSAPAPLIPPFLYFDYTLNTAGAFSIPIPSMLLSIAYVFVLMLVGVLWKHAGALGNPQVTWAALLICIGGASNAWDRVWHGGVIDMFALAQVGVCNVADIYIVCGVFLWLLYEYQATQTRQHYTATDTSEQ